MQTSSRSPQLCQAKAMAGVGDALEWARQQIIARVPQADLHQRDPDFIRDQLPGTWLLASLYFRADVRRLDRIPAEGPVLLIGNQSGGSLGGLKWDALHRGGGGRQLGCASRTNTYSALAIFSGMRKATLPCGSTFATWVVSVPTRLPAVSAR